MNNEFNTKAPHVVFVDAKKEIAFAMVQSGYHKGLKVLHKFNSFYIADAYVEALAGRIPEMMYSWLVWHKNKVSEDGRMVNQTKESLLLPSNLTTDEIKEAFTTVLNAKYPPGTWRLQYWLGCTDDNETQPNEQPLRPR